MLSVNWGESLVSALWVYHRQIRRMGNENCATHVSRQLFVGMRNQIGAEAYLPPVLQKHSGWDIASACSQRMPSWMVRQAKCACVARRRHRYVAERATSAHETPGPDTAVAPMVEARSQGTLSLDNLDSGSKSSPKQLHNHQSTTTNLPPKINGDRPGFPLSPP